MAEALAGRRLPLSAAALVVAVAAVSGCASSGPDASPAVPTATTAQAKGVGGAAASPAATPSATAPARLPGLGPKTLAKVPDDADQVVVATGRSKTSSSSQVVLYRRTASGWQAGATWKAHNALKGWTDDHHVGDLHSPIGVFTLSDAGGLLADPGSKLPYHRSSGFAVGGTGFEDEPLAGSFDYVIAIDYNRDRGTSPLNRARPLGAAKGGGIWLHVDHGGPTHACVSLSEAHMKDLLRTLDPARHPVIVMGDAASLSA
ncbi:L,D-transpeptidase family protein [Streptomyces sp. NPDC090306]|uniref:L,D-transpeptidase family protein n=1 Tax=Streptomyces sp. NPDC090306 TaxID=3365961 RepID=UPI0037FABF74